MFNHWSRTICIDLGTANTRLLVDQGDFLLAPSVIALDAQQNLLAAGQAARQMIGHAPPNIQVVYPLKNGVIDEYEATQLLLQQLKVQLMGGRSRIKPRVVIGVPAGTTPVEAYAFREVAKDGGVQQLFLIQEPIAAALGLGLPIMEPIGCMVVDIGAGKTEVAVISLGQTVLVESIQVAGDTLTAAIRQSIKKQHRLLIGELTAEAVKCTLGAADERPDETQSMRVAGVSLTTGLPQYQSIAQAEVREILAAPLAEIVSAILQALEKTPPELLSDISERGIVLTGGSSLLKGLVPLISQAVGLLVHESPEPLNAVVLGAAQAIAAPQYYGSLLKS